MTWPLYPDPLDFGAAVCTCAALLDGEAASILFGLPQDIQGKLLELCKQKGCDRP